MEAERLFPMNVTSLGVTASIWNDGKWHVLSHCEAGNGRMIRQHDT